MERAAHLRSLDEHTLADLVEQPKTARARADPRLIVSAGTARRRSGPGMLGRRRVGTERQ
jgi:hypothetical protein